MQKLRLQFREDYPQNASTIPSVPSQGLPRPRSSPDATFVKMIASWSGPGRWCGLELDESVGGGDPGVATEWCLVSGGYHPSRGVDTRLELQAALNYARKG